MNTWNKNWILTGVWLFLIATAGLFRAEHPAAVFYFACVWAADEMIIWGSREL